jgi:hypothetical protein
MRRPIKLCIRVVLFCTPIVFLICGIIIEKEAFVISGSMGILLAFIISILTEFHERQIQRRQNSIRILLNGKRAASVKNITIEFSHTVEDAIPEDPVLHPHPCLQSAKVVDETRNTGAPKDEPTKIEINAENI